MNVLSAALLSTVPAPLAASDQDRETHGSFPVALVSMPFVSHLHPSIQLGLLKPIAEAHGFPVETFHLYLDFAAAIKPSVYENLCNDGRYPLGDWLFSIAAFDDEAPDPRGAFLDFCDEQAAGLLSSTGRSRGELLAIRHEIVPEYLDSLMRVVDWGRFRVVGFTSTFQQNVASLALARRIKEEFPSVSVVFGGANFEEEMGTEYVRRVPWIDYAVAGEADASFPQLLAALARGGDPSLVPGVVCRDRRDVTRRAAAAPTTRLDDLPIPDYHEFFDRAERLSFLNLLPAAHRQSTSIPFESARGCWWGERKHCTFCGLNANGIAFRAKSAGRVERELGELSGRHGVTAFVAVDNIMDMSYFNSLLPALARRGGEYDLFYELKSNLRRDQIRRLGDAGVRCVQPGIESLSTPVLALMRKGVTGLQNVNTLRWCRYYGVDVQWNVLYGFPEETREDHDGQAALMGDLFHLQPPLGVGRIWLERFSPLFFDRARFPARHVRPQEGYRFVYPASIDLDKAAYFFDYQLENTLPETAFGNLKAVVHDWQARWRAQAPSLVYHPAPGGGIRVEDRRRAGSPRTLDIPEPWASAYAYLSDRPSTLAKALEGLNLTHLHDEMDAVAADWCAAGITAQEGRYYLSLALPPPGDRDIDDCDIHDCDIDEP
ncbi:MAG TPA: RiPP maturation radical SAM C-methyltransferase [Actinocrinis sp.]|uniref:RiPP maturation radical SAM C-methyltransferase n=1 Tax=Actinocrinis sp. TaxID=1920516 RepID=UPI002DDDA150|nr:RiPP maturation radical SAM C-methyltransferase [Actinocrinis sp.]HEV2343858.1 RiPP maturation radical SAM C-methyltransferase [Actinocrinis sp.]